MNRFAQKRQTLRQQKKASKNWFLGKTFRVSLIALVIVLGVLFLGKISSVSTKGFAISDLEEKKSELERETGKLEVEIAKYRSMKSIQERLAQIEMVESGEMEYVVSVGSEFARR
ncbi:MAG: hypothetical protein GF349_03285 [Candidatus Magasanikbacteria bacterium]|nr:hypothetical protein [Candidatus Magasanikbacteria bacterium]